MKKERKYIRKLTRFTTLLLILAVSLTLSGSSYATEDGRVTFTKSFAPNQNLMTLEEGDTSVAMALLTLQSGKVTAERTSAARVVNPNDLLRTAEDAMNAVFSSSVTYEGVLPDTDLEYTEFYNDIKNGAVNAFCSDCATVLSGLIADNLSCLEDIL